MIITAEQIMGWRPCPDYPEQRVKELIGSGKTPLEILDLDIPTEDQFWVVLRPEIIPERELRLLACGFAERVLIIFEKKHNGDNRPRNCIEVSRRFANGLATKDELAEAMVAAIDASLDSCGAVRVAARAASMTAMDEARAASMTASRASAVDAAMDAATYAAWAARGAARAAAWTAAMAAAWTAAMAVQIEDVREALTLHVMHGAQSLPHVHCNEG